MITTNSFSHSPISIKGTAYVPVASTTNIYRQTSFIPSISNKNLPFNYSTKRPRTNSNIYAQSNISGNGKAPDSKQDKSQPPLFSDDAGERYLKMLRDLSEQETALSNPLGLKMSHEIIQFDEDGFGPLDRYVYVEEQDCIGCSHCATTAPYTFMLEEEYGRARVFDQIGNVVKVVEEAIDTCPVNCIYYVSWDDLVTLEVDRKEQIINNFSRLVGGQDVISSKQLKRKTTVMDSGIMRCEDCPGRGCPKCPLYGVGQNPEFLRRKAMREAKKKNAKLNKAKKRNRKLM